MRLIDDATIEVVRTRPYRYFSTWTRIGACRGNDPREHALYTNTPNTQWTSNPRDPDTNIFPGSEKLNEFEGLCDKLNHRRDRDAAGTAVVERVVTSDNALLYSETLEHISEI